MGGFNFSKKRLNAIVLAGGKGVNMTPLTAYTHKTLLRILGKPLVQYSINALTSTGVKNIVLISREPKLFEKEVEVSNGLVIDHVLQKGDNVWSAIETGIEYSGVKTTTVIAYGDVLMPKQAYETTLTTHIMKYADATILITPVSDTRGYIKVEIDDRGCLVNAIEPRESSPGYVMGGLLVIERKFMEEILGHKGDLMTTLNECAKDCKVVTTLWTGSWIDVEYPWDLITATKVLLARVNETRISSKAKISSKAVVEGVVIIDDEAEVDHDSIIRGPVYIGRRVYVGNNALIRNFTSVENDSTIGSNTEITESIIESGVTVGRNSFIGNSVLGSDVIIEPGTVTLSVLPSGVEVNRLTPITVKGKKLTKLGMIVGSRTRIGANSVIYPGSIIDHDTYIKPLSTVKSSYE